jgi:hypothetical protein
MELGGVSFDVARDVYRYVFGVLLFYAVYRYARLYTNYLGGILAMLLAGVVYPVSFEHYAGQLTDPLSHLSFLLAFIFLHTGAFAAFLTTLLIGALAKSLVSQSSTIHPVTCGTPLVEKPGPRPGLNCECAASPTISP